MKTRFYKYLALPVLLLVSVFTLTSCLKNFDGTTTDYSEKEQEITGKSGGTLKPWSGNVELVYPNPGNGESIDQAGEHSLVTLKIYSLSQLDIESVKSAVSFHKLQDNSKNTD